MGRAFAHGKAGPGEQTIIAEGDFGLEITFHKNPPFFFYDTINITKRKSVREGSWAEKAVIQQTRQTSLRAFLGVFGRGFVAFAKMPGGLFV
jgi:hypothetical protein